MSARKSTYKRVKPKYSHRSLRRRIRRLLTTSGLTLLVLMMIGVGSVDAADGMRGNNCVVEKDEVVNHDFYFFCYNLTIRGTVDGDVIGLASRITVVRGSVVTGDIWVGGGQLVVEGQVDDDIHFAGGKLELTKDANLTSPRIDITAAAISVNIDEDATLPGDLLMLGYQAIIEGEVGANVDFQGQTLVISGTIGGNVDAIVGDRRAESPLRTVPLPYDIALASPGFVVRENSSIEGNLDYQAPQQVNLQRDTVKGLTTYKQSLQQADITRVEQSETFYSVIRSYLVSVLQDTVSLVIVGMFALQFMPIIMTEPGKRVQRASIAAGGWGFMMFFLSFPLALLLIAISALLIFLITLVTLGAMFVASILFFIVVNVVLIGGFWFLLVFLGPAVTCYIVGMSLIRFAEKTYLQRRADPDEPPIYVPDLPSRYRWVALVVGVVIFSFIVNMPIPASINTLKLLIQATVAFSGLGAIFMYGRDVWHISRDDWMVGDFTSDRLEMIPIDQDVPLGLENLPGDFNGFFE